MLPRIRRVSSILLNDTNKNNDNDSYKENNKFLQSFERLSNKSTSSSNKSIDDENNVYTETLLYIVHVDDIDLSPTIIDDRKQKICDDDIDTGQRSTSLNEVVKHVYKRTTASFNERHQTSKGSVHKRPSFNFSNSVRRLNSLLKNIENSSTSKPNAPQLCSAMKKRSSTRINECCKEDQINSNNKHEEVLSIPCGPFLHDNQVIRTDTEQQSIIRADGPGLSDGFVNYNCHFDLNAPNAELQKLVITIDGPSKADIQIEVVDIGLYRVFYTCPTSGNYRISVTYDGEQVAGSPYNLRLHPKILQEQVVPFNLRHSFDQPHVTIEPVEFNINSPCIVTVRPIVPCAIFQAYIQAPHKNINLPIMVHKSAKAECYEIYFMPNICGNYWLNISLDHIPIYDNPYRLMIRSYSSPNCVNPSVQNFFRGYKDESSQFFVSKSSNDLSSERGTFTVGISGPSTVFLDANETEHGYEFHYKPMRTGKYIITIKNAGKHIRGSPFTFCVHHQFEQACRVLSTMHKKENDLESEAATTTTTTTTIRSTTQARTSYSSLMPSIPSILNPIRSSTRSTNHIDLDILRLSMIADASQVCVFGTGLYETKSGRKTTFKIDASQAGPGLLLVGLYSSLGIYERLVVKRILPFSPAYVYKVSYRVRIRGQYMLVILYGSNMQHVPGSPYLINVE